MFTLVACLVVVGLSAAAVLAQTRGGTHQPATEHPRPHRRSGVGHQARPLEAGLQLAAAAAGEPGDTTRWLPAPPSPEPPDPLGPQAAPVAPRRRWQRIRSAATLVLIVLVTGVLLATIVGAAAALTAFSLREAVR